MPDAIYTLPDLPYDPGALEPHISGKIMELHHDKHHAAYVKGANAALEKLAELRGKGDFTTISMLEKTWRSTCPGMCCTRCSGPISRRKVGVSLLESWQR